mmetsp:Transcript_42611/g.101170  ORF Transcript_42611/g.101170 Transcript_42611/m.101170 type:complete len:294 (-) Transcript_42611:161-1042(-)
MEPQEPYATCQETPTISFNALRRARRTVEDFAKSYFFHLDLTIPEDFFRFLDVLVYVEGTIYQMDERNEAMCRAEDPVAAGGAAPLEGFEELRGVLRSLGLLDERVSAELDQGLSYWREERRLCAAMRSHPPLRAGCTPEEAAAARTFTPEEVHECSLRKSFDYRVLNLVLHRLTERPYDETLLEFLLVDEHLVDISDDLVDYEEDIFANSFNIFRAYVFLFGSDAQLKLVERISEWERRREGLLQQLPPAARERVRMRESEAAREDGADEAKWAFPNPIFDEAKYLSTFSES